MGKIIDGVIDIKTRTALVLTDEDIWNRLSEDKRRLAIAQYNYIKPLLNHKALTGNAAPAIELLMAKVTTGRCNRALLNLADEVSTKNQSYPSEATLYRWIKKYENNKLLGLAGKQKGRVRKDYGWEAEAIRLHQQPTNPDYGDVTYMLKQAGWQSATYSRVRNYLITMPATMGKYSRKRMGGHYYDQNTKPYVIRDETVLDVGAVYEGDGHNCDVYIAHPSTGNAWRPELTIWIDVRSHYVVGWWLSEVESGINTLYSLSHALLKHDHVCDRVHVDTGSGFKNRMMTGDTDGFLQKVGITFAPARTGNARGKGLVEGWFNHFEKRCGKQFKTYCGHVRTDRYLSQLRSKVKNGKIKLPSFEQYRDAVAAYIDSYNNNPQKRLGCSPSDVWATLVKNPLHISSQALIRPSKARKVIKSSITIFNRVYRSPELERYNRHEVVVEYDMHNDNAVFILDNQRRFICEATLVNRAPWLSASVIEDDRQKRVEGQIKRKQYDIEELKHRSRENIDPTELANQILDDGHTVDAIEQGTTLLPADDTDVLPEATPNDKIDIFHTDY